MQLNYNIFIDCYLYFRGPFRRPRPNRPKPLNQNPLDRNLQLNSTQWIEYFLEFFSVYFLDFGTQKTENYNQILPNMAKISIFFRSIGQNFSLCWVQFFGHWVPKRTKITIKFYTIDRNFLYFFAPLGRIFRSNGYIFRSIWYPKDRKSYSSYNQYTESFLIVSSTGSF